MWYVPNKVIQVPMDEKLLAALDRLSRGQKQPRAEIIRDACRKYIQRSQEEIWDTEYEEGYERLPETTELDEASLQLAAEGFDPEEKW
jgi:metal-responsive CopG/Arc/MetJ family transcriptional regulator